MQYNVPQFVEVEDKIIGPLSLRQFLTLLAGGLILLVFWKIFGMGAVFFALALPIVGIAAFLAFGTYNGRPIYTLMPNAIKFFSSSRERVFQRTGEKTFVMSKKVLAKPKEKIAPEEVSSRLKRLAYLLDQKTAEEERLIHSGQLKGKWMNQI